MILRFSKMDTLQLISYIFNRQVRRPLRPCAKRKSNRFGLGGPITKLVQLPVQHDMCPRFFLQKSLHPIPEFTEARPTSPLPPPSPPHPRLSSPVNFFCFQTKGGPPGGPPTPHPPPSSVIIVIYIFSSINITFQ